MDPNAPISVAKGTVITCLVNSLIFSAYGTFKRLPIGPLAASAAVNGGIVGATFFSFREYIISPQLLLGVNFGQFSRRKKELDAVLSGTECTAEKLDWWRMRAHMLPDTAISGALTGGVLNAWKRGRSGIVSGAVTASLLCTFLQLAYNELGISRLKFISEQLQKADAVENRISENPPTNRAVVDEPVTVTSSKPSKPASERVFGWFGFQRVSDEDYLLRLKAERDAHLERILELEAEQNDKSTPK